MPFYSQRTRASKPKKSRRCFPIMERLEARELLSITQLTTGTAITRQAVTKHLHILARAGMVHHLKAGRERLWQFEPAPLMEARRSLEVIGQQWDYALRKLKMAVEVP